MAVFRSDQAQVTFASEVVQGGDFERISLGNSPVATSYLSAAANAGDRSIVVASTSSYAVGDFIRIGNHNSLSPSESRRVEHIAGTTDGVLHLDRPLAFTHPKPGSSDSNTNDVTGVWRFDDALDNFQGRKYVTLIPGIYESVEVPDLQTSIEPRYFLGTASRRNFFQAYKGQQTFTGGISDMVLLNGWPLRFPIGKVITVPRDSSGNVVTTGNSLTPGAALVKGDIHISGDHTGGLSIGDYVVFSWTASPLQSTNMEVRRVSFINSSGFEINYPLMFAQGTGAMRKVNIGATGFHFEHHIVETVDLDTISMHVHMRSSAEDADDDFDRRYVGGMVGSMTIRADEGGY